jgi:hypothetical protein
MPAVSSGQKSQMRGEDQGSGGEKYQISHWQPPQDAGRHIDLSLGQSALLPGSRNLEIVT